MKHIETYTPSHWGEGGTYKQSLDVTRENKEHINIRSVSFGKGGRYRHPPQNHCGELKHIDIHSMSQVRKWNT